MDEKLRKPAFLQPEYEMVVLPNEVTNLSDYLAVRRAGRGIALSRRQRRERVVNGLNERGVNVRSLDSGAVPAGRPVALTMHRAKGTEFVKVLLFGLSAKSVPMGLSAHDYDETELADAMLRERSLVYVAASRARDELVVTWSGAPSPLLPSEGH